MKLIDFGLSAFYVPGKRLRVHCGSPSYAGASARAHTHTHTHARTHTHTHTHVIGRAFVSFFNTHTHTHAHESFCNTRFGLQHTHARAGRGAWEHAGTGVWVLLWVVGVHSI